MAGSDQPLIQKILDKLKSQLNNPASQDLFLPNIIKSDGFDPYSPAKPWLVDPIPDEAGKQIARNICTGVFQSRGEFGIPDPKDPLADLTLSDLLVNGASQMLVTELLSSGDNGFDITVETSGSGPIKITGNFELNQSCCQVVNPSEPTCSASPENERGTGPFVATVTPGNLPILRIQLRITELAQNVLTFEADRAEFTPDLAGIDIQADVSQLPAFWQSSVNEVLEASSTKQAILDQVNLRLKDAGFLTKIGDTLTQRVDDFLRKNNQYPFDESFASLF